MCGMVESEARKRRMRKEQSKIMLMGSCQNLAYIFQSLVSIDL
jgi:hypothetical protein